MNAVRRHQTVGYLATTEDLAMDGRRHLTPEFGLVTPDFLAKRITGMIGMCVLLQGISGRISVIFGATEWVLAANQPKIPIADGVFPPPA